MAIAEQDMKSMFADKEIIRRIIDEQNVNMGFVPDPTATAQRGREKMRVCGVRPEDNIGTRGLIEEREQRWMQASGNQNSLKIVDSIDAV